MTKAIQRKIWWGLLAIGMVLEHVWVWHWWAFLSIPLSIVVGIYFAWLIND